MQATSPRGIRYICQNPKCRKEMEMAPGANLNGGCNPRCSCGAEMKKAYSKPVLQKWAPFPMDER